MSAGPLVVTYPLTGRSREIVAEELDGIAEAIFLVDLAPADRAHALGRAGAVLAHDTSKELRPDEILRIAVLAKIAGRDAPPAQGSKIASVRTSIDSRGAASAGVSGNSKALCGVKRARSPRLSQPLISRTSSRSIFGA